jgi:hypothetical protein
MSHGAFEVHLRYIPNVYNGLGLHVLYVLNILTVSEYTYHTFLAFLNV